MQCSTFLLAAGPAQLVAGVLPVGQSPSLSVLDLQNRHGAMLDGGVQVDVSFKTMVGGFGLTVQIQPELAPSMPCVCRRSEFRLAARCCGVQQLVRVNTTLHALAWSRNAGSFFSHRALSWRHRTDTPIGWLPLTIAQWQGDNGFGVL